MTVQGRHRDKKVHQNRRGRKPWRKSRSRVFCQKQRSISPWTQMKTMKNLKNEPGTSSNTQPTVPVLPLPPRSATSPQGPSTSTSSEDESTDDDDEHGERESGPAIQSARSHDSRRTVLYPDLRVLTNVEHWTMTPETHKYAVAAGSFCFVTTENGEQQDVCNLTAIPCVQRSLCLDELTNDSSSTQVEIPRGVDSHTRDMLERCVATCGKAARARAKRRSHARKQASYEDTTSSLLERNTSSGNPGLTMRF